MSLPTARQRRRGALAHPCPECRRHWASAARLRSTG